MILYKYPKTMVRSFDCDVDFFDIVAEVLRGNILALILTSVLPDQQKYKLICSMQTQDVV